MDKLPKNRGAKGKRPASSPGNALQAARLALGLLKDRFASKEGELAWMNGEYAKLMTKLGEAEKRAIDLEGVEDRARMLDKEVKVFKERLATVEMDLKSEKEFTAAQEKARDEWKAFALSMVVQLIAIDSVVKDAPGDEPAAVRQLVLGAKKVPHPAADPTHPNIWKWALLGGIDMLGAAYFLYTSMGSGAKAGAAPPAAAP